LTLTANATKLGIKDVKLVKGTGNIGALEILIKEAMYDALP